MTRAVLTAEFRREGATVEEAEAKAEEAVQQMAAKLVFGQVPAQAKSNRHRSKPEVKALYFRSLFEAKEDDRRVALPADEPAQLAMFAL